MLDIRLLRETPDLVKQRLAGRDAGLMAVVDEILRIDAARRAAETERQALQGDRNRNSKEIDHAGSIEGSVIERGDGTLYLLLRTESGFLWEATSKDGLKWEDLKPSAIPSVTCCPQMARLADGRIDPPA